MRKGPSSPFGAVATLFGMLASTFVAQTTGAEQVSNPGGIEPPVGEILFQRTVSRGNLDIFVVRTDGSMLRQLTTSPGFDGLARWSPDGQRIVFVSNRGAMQGQVSRRLYIMNADGSGVRRVTNHEAFFEANPTWSPDGRKIAFVSLVDARPDDPPDVLSVKRQIFVVDVDTKVISKRDGNSEIYKMRPNGSEQTRLTDSAGFDGFASWSPDGQWIVLARHQDPGGESSLYLERVGDSQPRPIGVVGTQPDWRPLGKTR